MRDFYNEKHFNEACPYSYASVYYFINKTAYSGMIRYNSSGEYNVPYGRYKTLGIDCVTRNHSELLKSADIFNADYSSVFEMAQPNDFMFLDPPYDCVFQITETRHIDQMDLTKLLTGNLRLIFLI